MDTPVWVPFKSLYNWVDDKNNTEVLPRIVISTAEELLKVTID